MAADRRLTAKFKKDDVVRWNALTLHGAGREGWIIDGLERMASLLPIYNLHKGSVHCTAVENELEPAAVPTIVQCPTMAWVQECLTQCNLEAGHPNEHSYRYEQRLSRCNCITTIGDNPTCPAHGTR